MKALILVDLQNDFCKNGALEVPQGNDVVPIANALMDHFECIIATQDWHPANHKSFAANHLFQKPGNVIELNGLQQILWPIHCVQESLGAMFVKELDTSKITKVFQKGTDPEIDSYSGFFDNGRLKSTGLGDYLKTQNVTDVYVLGLATDYCVKYTALDAKSLGFNTFLIEDASRGVNLKEGDVNEAITHLKENEIEIIQSKKLLQS